MKKVLACALIAAAIIGGAVTYDTTHPEKQASTVVSRIVSTQPNDDATFTVNDINSDNENLNINEYMGDWRTTSLLGTLNSEDKSAANINSNINISQNNFNLSTKLADNIINNISVANPNYQIQRLPDNYFRISYHREPESLGLSKSDNYQLLVNNTPTDIYISNGKLIYNSSGAFFSLSK